MNPIPNCPQDIVDEINAIAVTEADREALLKMVGSCQKAQVARAFVALSKGSHAHLWELLNANTYALEDDRDLLTLANDTVEYEAGYFIESFPIIKARRRIHPKAEQEYKFPFKLPVVKDYSLCDDVLLHWNRVIVKYGFSVAVIDPKEVELSNQHVVMLVRVGHLYPLDCDFRPLGSSRWEEFELLAFIRALWGENATGLLPDWLSEVPEDQRIAACLEKYAALMLQYFSRPATGDFEWAEVYAKDHSDRNECCGKLTSMEKKQHPKTPAILRKYEQGDPTWRDDVRKILAEEEAERRSRLAPKPPIQAPTFWQRLQGFLGGK